MNVIVKSITVVSVLTFSVSRSAGGFNFEKFAGQAWKTATAPITVPHKTIVNAAQAVAGQKPPSAIFQPAKNAARDTGNVIEETTKLTSEPRRFILRQADGLAAKAGPAGSIIYDVGTFSDRTFNGMLETSNYTLANILQGKNPFLIVSAPLAAAIRDAHDRHSRSAKKLPEDVIAGLSAFFESHTLRRARYTVGNVEISLPNAIGKSSTFMGEPKAVVVDNVIIFPHDPGSFEESAFWWGHEVKHVEQYEEWGIDDFAFRYVKSAGRDVEREADEMGKKVVEEAVSSGAIESRQAQVAARAMVKEHTKHTETESNARPKTLLPPSVVEKLNELKEQTERPPDAELQPVAIDDPIIIECVFPEERNPVRFFGTKSGKIVAFNLATGQWVHLGFAAQPVAPGSAWTYRTNFVMFDVLPAGQIMQRGRFGPRQVGHVVRF